MLAVPVLAAGLLAGCGNGASVADSAETPQAAVYSGGALHVVHGDDDRVVKGDYAPFVC